MRPNNKKSPWLGSVYTLNLTFFKILVNIFFFSYNYRVINLIWQKNKKNYNNLREEVKKWNSRKLMKIILITYN